MMVVTPFVKLPLRISSLSLILWTLPLPHSTKRSNHMNHHYEIFLRCRYYHIHLNPHKCVFCVESNRLLEFVVSKEGIRLDPIKVEAMLNLPLHASLQQL